MVDEDDITQALVSAGEFQLSDIKVRRSKKGDYPEPYDGNIRPTSSPDYSMFILYQVLKGRNINVSFRRMCAMLTDIDDVENIGKRFSELYGGFPDDSQYRLLAQAVASRYGLEYTYEPTEVGDIVRVWKTSGKKAHEEFAFNIVRGEYIQRRIKRDYSKLLGVKPSDMLSYKKVMSRRRKALEPFRR